MKKIPLFLVAAVATLPLACATATAAQIELVSRTSLAGPMDGNGRVERIDALTPDGRHTLFSSSASNLVAGDTNRSADLFLHDGTTGSIERVSVGTGGIQAQGSVGPIGAVSDDGRYVVFDSDASNLVATPTHGVRQIYLRDRSTGTTTLLTRFNSGVAAMADSANPRISADGRHVAFDSHAAFDADDTNGRRDVYRLDRQSGEFELISVSADGRVGNADSYEPQISADGSAVVFYTWANNLVAGDTNIYWDLLLRKPAAGTTQRVSLKADGGQMNSYPQPPQSQALSGDGRYVVFNAYEPLVADDTNDLDDGYRYDSQNGTIERVTLGAGGQIDNHADVSALSRDGQRVLMQSAGAGIVAGQLSGNSRVFQRDLVSGAITHVTFRAGGEQLYDDAYGGFMSEDASVVVATTWSGSFVAGDTNNMVDVLRQDGRDSAATRVSAPSAGVIIAAANQDSGDWSGFAASADQRYVAFGSRASNLVVGDTNGAEDIFVRDRLLGTNERVSVSTAGGEGFCGNSNADISADGRYVAFHSCSALVQAIPFPLMHVYRHDRLTHTTEVVDLTPQGAMANSYSLYPSISGDGRYVAFGSCASDLVANDVNAHCDVFVRDMQAGTTVLASRSHDGLGADQDTYRSEISGDGSTVAFTTMATNLVTGDTNGESDVFVFDRSAQTVARVSVSSLGVQADRSNTLHGLSNDGRQLLFNSFATNFGVVVPFAGLYVHDRDTGTTELVSRTSSGDALNGNLNTAAISGDGRRVALTTDGNDSGFGTGLKLVLFERDRARLGLVRDLDYYHPPRGSLQLDGNGTHLLLASGDNRLVDDDGNNHFSDVFLFDKLSDYLFDDGFEPAQ
jgi:Tol biopolymer transport system component